MNNLEIVVSAIDNASSTIASIGGNMDSLTDAAKLAADGFAALGAAASAAETAVLVAAADAQVATVNLNTSIQDNIDIANAAAKGQGAFATELEYAKTQMQLAQTELTKLTNDGKSSADQIDQQQQKLAVLTGKYDELNGRLALAGQTAAQVEALFQPAIDAGVQLGFSVDSSSAALNTLESVLGDPAEALKALSVAQDLARAKGIDLASAANMVTMGMNGMGRGLQTSGIFIKDGISGMEALDAIQQQVNGHAQAYANTLTGQLAVAWAGINKIMADVGAVQIPWLTDMVKDFNDLVSIMGDFISGAPKATSELNDFLLKMGVGQETINNLNAAWLLVTTAWTTTVEPAILSLWNTLQPYIPFLIEFAGLLVLDVVVGLEAFVAGLAKVLDVGIQVVQFFSDSLVGSIKAFVDEVKEAVTWVEKLITSIAKVGGGVLGSIGSAIGGAVSAVSSVIPHFATGGIVSSPTIALIGEAGPEAIVPLSGSSAGNFGGSIGGNSAGITINIGSLMGTDSNAARTFANQIADILTRQLKVRTI